MSGLHTSSLMVGLLCLVGAVVGAFALPGRVSHVPDEVAGRSAEPVAA